jgi:riboflavin kinase/FMN adenylyltransferase
VRAQSLESGQHFKGMCNIGHRPTIQGRSKTIEVNLFDFGGDIYGEHMRLFFVDRIRDEHKFVDLDALKNQLAKDEISCREILA